MYYFPFFGFQGKQLVQNFLLVAVKLLVGLWVGDLILPAVNSTWNTGELALKPGDYLVIDNCPIHHNRAERVLVPFLDRLGIEYIFTPTYSPNLNPAELCFQHIKTMFKTRHISRMARNNLEYTIMHCLNSVTSMDCKGYYKHVGFMQV